MGFRDWLRVFRAQTAPATLLVVMVPFLLGGGNLFSFFGLALFVFAIVLHWFIFGHNSLMDTATGFDLKDKNKQHHPLVSGKISLNKAHNVIHTGLCLLTVLGILLVLLSPGNHLLAISWFLVFMVTGFAYNNGLSKSTIFSFVPITVCFTSLSVFAYYLSAQAMSPLMVLAALYIAFVEIFQISYEGELKELEAGEANLLRRLGAKIEQGFFVPNRAGDYGTWVKAIGLAIAGLILWVLPSVNVFSFILFLILLFFAGFYLARLTRFQKWDRNKALMDMSKEEIVSIYILPVVLIPLIGAIQAISLMAFGVVYFFAMNKLNWGVFYPKV